MLTENPIHYVNERHMFNTYPEGMEQMMIGMGCFWGVERIFWKLEGVYVTSVGYGGGADPAPTYKSVCTGRTGHAELVHIVFDPKIISYEALLKTMFEYHDPTQKDRQGNDVGAQYRSLIAYYCETQKHKAQDAIERYAEAYGKAITTELIPAGVYYPAEDYHQQYLAKNPQGYCMHGLTGVFCSLPESVKENV